MLRENEAEQIKNRTVEAVCSRTNARHTLNTVFHRRLQPDSFIVLNRKQVIHHLKRRLPAVRIVNASQIREIVKGRFFIVSKVIANLEDAFGGNVNGELSDTPGSVGTA